MLEAEDRKKDVLEEDVPEEVAGGGKENEMLAPVRTKT